MSIFEELRKYCPRKIVSREELKDLTGGLLCRAVITKLDHKGRGINQKIIGKRVYYNIDDVIKWLEDNTRLMGF